MENAFEKEYMQFEVKERRRNKKYVKGGGLKNTTSNEQNKFDDEVKKLRLAMRVTNPAKVQGEGK